MNLESGITNWELAALPTFSFAPAISVCLLVPGLLLALVLCGMLYREQRRMAPLRTVVLLMLLRGMLIALLAVLFLQPALQWKSTRTSSGTLWVVVDQSPSMQTPDPQALPNERLHWADGMGLIKRPDRPDELLARLHVLADEIDALSPDTSGGDEKQAVRSFADRAAAWNKDLDKLASEIETTKTSLDTFATGAGTNAYSELTRVSSLAKSRISASRSATSLRAARQALDATDIGQSLARADASLRPAVTNAEKAYLSQNQTNADWTSANSRVASMTREELTQGFLTGSDAKATKLLADLAQKYHLRIASFSDKAQAAGAVDTGNLAETLKSALVPSGQATNLAGSLQFVAEQISADEAASVIIISDGRNNIGPDPTGPARNLSSRGVRVYGMLMGSHELSPDAAVEPVDFPDWIYAGDSIKPRALIRMDGLAGKQATVELRRGGQVLKRQTVATTEAHEMIPFDFVETPPASEKVLEYEIRVSQMPGEVNTQNNVATFRVAIKKDKLYALMIEDRPRWEFRYLAAYLSLRPGMKLQTVLLQPALVDKMGQPAPVVASPDNPHTEAQLLPTTLQDWQKFDLIIVGDVGPDTLTAQMQQYIAATVRDKGATLITIAGQKAMPEKYAATPFAELLPVTLNSQWPADQISRHTLAGFRPAAAPTAGMSVLAQLAADTGSNTRVWGNMPTWYWHSAFTEAKPAAAVVWSIGENGAGGFVAAGGGGGGDPLGTIAEANRHSLLSTMTVGLGHSLYLASDQTWRMRQVGGANLHDKFWGQVLNWAVGSDLPAGGKYVRFGANQPTYEQTQPVVITARVLKDDLTPYRGLAFSAVARAVYGAGTQPAAATGGAEGNTVEAKFEPMESPGYYQATLAGLPNGDVEISLKGAEVQRLLDTDPTVTLKTLLIKVYPTMNAERRNMNTDPAQLEALARAGGGFSVDGPYADLLLSRMPAIEHVETTVYQLGFFTDPLAAGTQWAHWGFLTLFAALITLEWGLRKRAGLV